MLQAVAPKLSERQTSGLRVTTQTINNDIEIMRDNLIAKLSNPEQIAYVRSLSPDEFLSYKRETMLSGK